MAIPWLGEYTGPTIAAKRSYELVLGKMIQQSPLTESDIEVEYLNSASVQWNGIETNPDKTMWASPAEVGHLSVEPGDLLVCEGGDVGRTAIYNGDPGKIFQNSLHRARSQPGSDVRYLKYLLTALHSSGWLDILCNKATIAHFTVEKLGSLELPHVALDEQRRIADFLDAETARIDLLQESRGRQLALLDERAEAWRSRLFMQSNSGMWVRVKHLLRVKPRYGVLVPEFVDDGIPMIRVGDLGDLANCDGLLKIPRFLSAQYSRTVTMQNDVLVAVVGATIGKVALVTENVAGSNVNRAIAVLRVQPRNSATLFASWVGGTEFKEQAHLATSADSAQPTLGMEDLANFSLRWPADDAEQEQMASLVEEYQLEVHAARLALERQVGLLTERRQALITAAVTGGITV